MTKSEIKVGMKIISPLGYTWKVIKYYSPDVWRIKNTKGQTCVLSRGQLRGWKKQK